MTRKKIEPIDPAQLAESHWEYVASVIYAHTGAAKEDRDYIICKHHYVSAFIHGFKHGKENTKCN